MLQPGPALPGHRRGRRGPTISSSVLDPASSSSTSSSGNFPRRSSGNRSRIPGEGAGSPNGLPAPPRSEPLARTTESTSPVVGMSLLSSDTYTVVMAFGHPGTVKSRGAATVLSPLDAVRAAADPAGVCSSVVATFLVPSSPHTVWRGSLARNPGMVPSSPLLVSTSSRGSRRAAIVTATGGRCDGDRCQARRRPGRA